MINEANDPSLLRSLCMSTEQENLLQNFNLTNQKLFKTPKWMAQQTNSDRLLNNNNNNKMQIG